MLVICQMLTYFNILENAVREKLDSDAVEVGPDDIQLPPPFDAWLMGGVKRLEVNLKYMVDYVKEKS
jgi:hypothetical protein